MSTSKRKEIRRDGPGEALARHCVTVLLPPFCSALYIPSSHVSDQFEEGGDG
jgi:hypothetical protein